MKPAFSKAPVHIELAPSPPRKKIKEIVVGEAEVDTQDDIENILHSMKKMEVDEENEEISDDEKVPDRLKSMLKIKGLDIKENKFIKVGGGGKCGQAVKS